MRLAAPLAAYLLAACASAPPDWRTPEGWRAILDSAGDGKWVFMASCDGNDYILQQHVRNLLRSEGVPCGMMGSLTYGIEVPVSLEERARKVLREWQGDGFYVCTEDLLSEEDPPALFLEWETSAEETRVFHDLPVSVYLAGEEPDPFLAAALRERREAMERDGITHLVEVDRWDRPYMDSRGRIRMGAYLEVHLSSIPGTPNAKWWDEQSCFLAGFDDETGDLWVRFVGGSGCGPDPEGQRAETLTGPSAAPPR